MFFECKNKSCFVLLRDKDRKGSENVQGVKRDLKPIRYVKAELLGHWGVSRD